MDAGERFETRRVAGRSGIGSPAVASLAVVAAAVVIVGAGLLGPRPAAPARDGPGPAVETPDSSDPAMATRPGRPSERPAAQAPGQPTAPVGPAARGSRFVDDTPQPGQALDLGGLAFAETDAGALPTGAADVAVGFGAVWLATAADATLRRLDPVGLEVLDAIPLADVAARHGGPIDIIVGGDTVWTLGLDPARAYRTAGIDARSAGWVAIGGRARVAVAGHRGLWIGTEEGALVRVDVRRAGLTSRLALGSPVVALAVGETGVWASTADGGLHHVDPLGRRLVARYPFGGGGIGVARGAVWVSDGPAIVRIDEETGTAIVAQDGELAAFSAERATQPAERRESWIAPNRAGLALGLGVWWRWDAERGTLSRTPRRGG